MDNITTEDLLDELTKLLDAEQADDIVQYDVKRRSSIADYLIICSAKNSRHTKALAGKLTDKLREAGMREIGVEGLGICHWVIVDAGGIMIHIFKPDVRELYDLEQIWAAKANS